MARFAELMLNQKDGGNRFCKQVVQSQEEDRLICMRESLISQSMCSPVLLGKSQYAHASIGSHDQKLWRVPFTSTALARAETRLYIQQHFTAYQVQSLMHRILKSPHPASSELLRWPAPITSNIKSK